MLSLWGRFFCSSVKNRDSILSFDKSCKPGFVENNHLSGSQVTLTFMQPTRTKTELRNGSSSIIVDVCPYLALLLVGFTLPTLLPKWRCALTAPFHPYLRLGRRYIFCGTFPQVTLAGRYPAPCFLEPGLSSDFPKETSDYSLLSKLFHGITILRTLPRFF